MDFQSYTLINNSWALKLSVQKLDSAIHRINQYSADKTLGNQLLYPLQDSLTVAFLYSVRPET